jgi:hypothetical protein
MMCRPIPLLALAFGLSFTGGSAQMADAPEDEGGPFDAGWPFRVGESATYDVTFGPIRVGRASLAIEARERVRQTEAFRLAFELEGGPFFYKVDDRQVGWLATAPYRSLRFEQILDQGGYERHRRWELDHGSSTYVREDWDERAGGYRADREDRDVPIPPNALDEISFLYLVRTLPLEVGDVYRFDNYFLEGGNPVVVEVLRRESVRVRAGRFETIVIRPVIQTDGIFSEEGEAEVYISDDDRRVIVQLKSKMKVGEMNMYLRELERGEG